MKILFLLNSDGYVLWKILLLLIIIIISNRFTVITERSKENLSQLRDIDEIYGFWSVNEFRWMYIIFALAHFYDIYVNVCTHVDIHRDNCSSEQIFHCSVQWREYLFRLLFFFFFKCSVILWKSQSGYRWLHEINSRE